MRLWAVGMALAAIAAAQTADAPAKAREMAAGGQGKEALALLEQRLKDAPRDVDSRLVYGTILSWERRYDEARQQLGMVLAAAPDYLDARYAAVNVEIWSAHPQRAEALAREGLAKHPRDAQLRLALARALHAERRDYQAAAEARRLLAIQPDSQEGKDLLDTLAEAALVWGVSFDETHEWFSRGYTAWDQYEGSVRRATADGPVIANFYRADRLGQHSSQGELEFYPHLRPGTDLYLEAAYSPDPTLLPRYRMGIDLNQALGHGFEGSAGYRRLSFADPVNIYTGSLSKYAGQWLVTARVFEVPNLKGVTQTVQVGARRYLGDGGDYVSWRFGRGATAEEITNVTDLAILRATTGEMELNKSLGRRWRASVRGGLAREERVNNGSVNHYLLESRIWVHF